MPTYLPARQGISQSEALAEAYASATATQPELITLAFYHNTFVDEFDNPTAIYVVNDYDPLVATIESDAAVHGGVQVTFQPIPFKFIRPEEADGGKSPEITIELENISREITPYLKSAAVSGTPITVTMRVYLASDTSAPHEIPPMSLVLRDVTVTTTTISARAGYGDMVNKKFPTKDYNRRSHPGLVAS